MKELNVLIDDKELEKLFTTGTSKKLALPADIAEKFFATVQKIESAKNIYDLWADSGLKFEKLRGKGNYYSMRLSKKYRLVMEVLWQNEKKTLGEFILKTISNHYS